MKKKAKFKKDRMVTCTQKRLKINSLLDGMEVTCKQKKMNTSLTQSRTPACRKRSR